MGQIQILAKQVVETLVDAGYTAYFAGGWVRDYLMKHPSSDIDIATNASPEEVVQLFDKTIQVGALFGVVVVVLNDHSFEVASFRKDGLYVDGRKPVGIEFSTPEEDAARRDFTINGMFYDPLTHDVLDYVGGREDLTRQVIRAIGDPHNRFAEDRLRMIRAVRFAVRFRFSLDQDTEKAIFAHAHQLLPAVSMERIWQELRRMHLFAGFDRALCELHRLGLLPAVFHDLKDVASKDIQERTAPFSKFPKECPTILYVMELFPGYSLAERVELCRYLKATNHDRKWVELIWQGQELTRREDSQGVELVEWNAFYASPGSLLCLEVESARMPEEKSERFLGQHRRRMEKLQPHVCRHQESRPLVTSHILKDAGIMPGKMMGDLIREAERIAVNHDLHDAPSVLDRLKQSPLWPT